MNWSFISDHEYVCPSHQDNPWTGKCFQPIDKVSVAMLTDDWFCMKFEQLNLHLIEGHTCGSGDRNWLPTDPFVKPPKSQARWYARHNGPDPAVIRPGKSVIRWSREVSPELLIHLHCRTLIHSHFTKFSSSLPGDSPQLGMDFEGIQHSLQTSGCVQQLCKQDSG